MSPAAPAHRFVEYDKFLDCVHCGLCLTACPTYRELGTEMDSPRGRIYLMRALEDGAVAITPDLVHHLDLCLGCRACETACPSGVRYGEIIEAARSFVEDHHRRPWLDRWTRELIALIFPHPHRLRIALSPLVLLERIGLLARLRSVSKLIGMLPPLGHAAPVAAVTPARGPERHRVGLIAGCVAQVLFPQTNTATVRVLAQNGCTVIAPVGQSCCGALYLHAGKPEAARACARRNLEAFPEDLDAIIINAAGCGATLKDYGRLLADDRRYADRARAFSAKVRDITEFLAALPPRPPKGTVRARVTYHDACHLAHGQGVREAPRQLLRMIPGIELVELAEADTCCGSAGSYNLTEPGMARRLAEHKVANIRATGASCVAAANPGCILQIQAALHRAGHSTRVVHPIELLDQAYRDERLQIDDCRFADSHV